MNQPTRLSAMIQAKNTPISNQLYFQNTSGVNQYDRNISSQHKKTPGFRYQRSTQTNLEFLENNYTPVSNIHTSKNKLVEVQDPYQQPQKFFFKNERVEPQQPRQSTQKISESQSFRKSPSFRLKQQQFYNNNEQSRNLELDSNDTKKISRRQNRSDSNNLHNNERRVRIDALESYIRGINDENTSKIKFSRNGAASTNYESSTAHASIIEDVENNLEEMHFYFVEFQQKSKQWMTKIEQKIKK